MLFLNSLKAFINYFRSNILQVYLNLNNKEILIQTRAVDKVLALFY